MDDVQIHELVTRLSRPHPSGGVVIERAAILAAGADSPAVIDWIIAHSGTPDTAVRTIRGRGLHGSRMTDDDRSAPQAPLRFVLPAGSLS
jgi:enterochelin esterase-like enzyme